MIGGHHSTRNCTGGSRLRTTGLKRGTHFTGSVHRTDRQRGLPCRPWLRLSQCLRGEDEMLPLYIPLDLDGRLCSLCNFYVLSNCAVDG